jgi:hypothetical protein
MKDLAKYEGGHKFSPKRDGDQIWPRCNCKWEGDISFSIRVLGYRGAKRTAERYWYNTHAVDQKN